VFASRETGGHSRRADDQDVDDGGFGGVDVVGGAAALIVGAGRPSAFAGAATAPSIPAAAAADRTDFIGGSLDAGHCDDSFFFR